MRQRKAIGRRSGPRRVAALAAALAVLAAAQWLGWLERPGDGAPAAFGRDDTARIGELFQERRSGVMVEATGEVARLLRDDDEGSRHQRFVLTLDGGQSLLVAHNIDLAPRAPVEVGDAVRFRGQYEWNERGGVLHWTHHDPDGRRPGGWLEHRGQRYR